MSNVAHASRSLGLIAAIALNFSIGGAVVKASVILPKPSRVGCICFVRINEDLAPTPFPNVRDWDSLTITLFHGCGRAPSTCPVYEVTIAGNGDVTFNGIRAVHAMGEHTAHISRAAVRALVAKFRAAKFFALPNTRVMDSSSRVTIAFDDHEKSLPGEVSNGLAEAIRKTAGTARWIGQTKSLGQ